MFHWPTHRLAATIMAIACGIALTLAQATAGEAPNGGGDKSTAVAAPATTNALAATSPFTVPEFAALAKSNPDAAEALVDGAQKAYFAAGCFWGVEAKFRQTPGVIATSVGFCGGRTEHPTYKQVCTNRTGHAETVEVVFDPKKVTYDQLLAVFFLAHDPTQLNRQGPDFGTQYRSAIFYANDEQQESAIKAKAALTRSKKYANPVVTQIVPLKAFWLAEDYHQQYLEKRGLASCPSH